MKKILIYREVLDELDLIREISSLIDAGMPEVGYNFVEFKLTDLEYEDKDNIFHYASSSCKTALEALGFNQDPEKDYLFIKGNIKFAFTIIYEENRFIIQRQA